MDLNDLSRYPRKPEDYLDDLTCVTEAQQDAHRRARHRPPPWVPPYVPGGKVEFADLPPEVVKVVVDYLWLDYVPLFPLLLTCKQFLMPAGERLYQGIIWTSPRDCYPWWTGKFGEVIGAPLPKLLAGLLDDDYEAEEESDNGEEQESGEDESEGEKSEEEQSDGEEMEEDEEEDGAGTGGDNKEHGLDGIEDDGEEQEGEDIAMDEIGGQVAAHTPSPRAPRPFGRDLKLHFLSCITELRVQVWTVEKFYEDTLCKGVKRSYARSIRLLTRLRLAEIEPFPNLHRIDIRQIKMIGDNDYPIWPHSAPLREFTLALALITRPALFTSPAVFEFPIDEEAPGAPQYEELRFAGGHLPKKVGHWLGEHDFRGYPMVCRGTVNELSSRMVAYVKPEEAGRRGRGMLMGFLEQLLQESEDGDEEYNIKEEGEGGHGKNESEDEEGDDELEEDEMVDGEVETMESERNRTQALGGREDTNGEIGITDYTVNQDEPTHLSCEIQINLASDSDEGTSQCCHCHCNACLSRSSYIEHDNTRWEYTDCTFLEYRLAIQGDTTGGMGADVEMVRKNFTRGYPQWEGRIAWDREEAEAMAEDAGYEYVDLVRDRESIWEKTRFRRLE
ncbi:hypothetical protein IAT38_002501 [Cryptococcus sp. DSM 104549]